MRISLQSSAIVSQKMQSIDLQKIIRFSDFDNYVAKLNGALGCIVDTNFLISISDEDHHFHDDALFLYEKLSDFKIPIYITVTARSEFIDFHRRVIITETLMDMLAPSSSWKISQNIQAVLRSQRSWLRSQSGSENLPLLTDQRIKICKKAFLPKTQSGQIGWVKLCEEYLKGRLLSEWEKIADALSLNYLDTKEVDNTTLFREDLKWENMYRISEETALGSSDAMILNLFNASIFTFLITSDYDLAYGLAVSTQNKVAIIPDNIYINHFKKMKF